MPPVIGYRDPSFLNPSNPFGAGFIAALAATGIPSLPGYGSNGTGAGMNPGVAPTPAASSASAAASGQGGGGVKNANTTRNISQLTPDQREQLERMSDTCSYLGSCSAVALNAVFDNMAALDAMLNRMGLGASDDPIVFINGFNAQGTVGAYIDHLLADRPELKGKWREFSYQDSLDDVLEYLRNLQGPITLIGNSLGGGNAADAALECQCVTTLVTLDPVGRLDYDWSAIRHSVDAWIDLRTPFGLADFAAEYLTQGIVSPWGDLPKPYVTKFIDNPPGISHAEFWPQMDIACGFDMRGCVP